jgi:diguanylate cyclase (GGDEF)-like protein/PAS domain S-box-containing protein/putative nucleotidyltransferase with HDIG domain
MRDEEKSKEQLISELVELRERFDEQSTKLKQAQEIDKALRDSEKRSHELADLLPQMIFETDEQGNLIYGNRCAYETLGYTPEDVMKGLNVTDFVLPEDRLVIVDNLLKTLEGQPIEHPRNDFTIIRKDGTTFPSLIWPSIIISDNKPAGIRGICVDITEMKKAEEALRKSEERYRSVVDNASEAIIVAQDGMLKFFNPRALEIGGYTPDELSAIPFIELIHPDDRQMVVERHLRRLQGEEFDHTYPFRVVSKDGKSKWMEINSVLISWNGNPATLNFLSDVTKRKLIEDALRQSEEKLRLIFDSIKDDITITDLEGRIISMNEAGLRMSGYSRKEDIIGRNGFEFIAEKDRARAIEDLTKQLTIKDGYTLSYYVLRDKDGKEFDAEVSAAVLPDINGNANGFITVVRDITKRKLAEKKLQESEDKYKQLVEQEKDVIFSVDASGHFTSINSAVVSWGFKPEQIIGRHFSEFIPAEWQDVVPGALDQILTSDDITAELVVSDANGKSRPIEFSATVIREGKEYRGVRGIVRDITERKHIEEALRESEQKLRLTFESINEAIILTDLEGRILDINEAGFRMSGYESKSQVIGVNGIQFFEEAARSSVQEQLAKLLKEGHIPIISYKIVSKTGQIYDVEASAVLLRDHDGNPTGLIVVIRNVSERKRMEEALRDSEEKLRFMFKSIIDAVVVVDLEGKILEVNDAGLILTGYNNRDDLIGVNAFDFVVEEDREKSFTDMMDSFKVGPGFLVQYRFKNKHGDLLFVEARGGMVFNASGEVTGFIVIVRDITERKRMEQALRDSEEKLRLTFESIEDAIVVIDLNGYITDLNEATLRIGGYTHKSQVIGRNAFELIAPKDFNLVMEDLKNRIAGRPKERMEYSIQPKGVKSIDVELTASTIHDEKDNPAGYIAVLRDITERKLAENQLRESEQKYKELVEREKDVIFSINESGIITSVNYAVTMWGYNPDEIIGRPYADFVPVKMLEKLEKNIPTRLLSEGEVVAEALGQDRTGTWRPIEFSATVILKDGNFAGVRGIVRDITERKLAEEALKQRNRELATLNKIAEAVSHPVGLSKLLKTALDSVLETMSLDYGSVWLADKMSLELRLSTARGNKDIQVTIADMNNALRSGETTVAKYRPEVKTARSGKKRREKSEQRKSIIGVPLKSKSGTVGVLGVVGDKHALSRDDMRLLETIGDQIAVAIENAQLVERLNELSITDDLTKLYNRRHFYEVLENEINRTRRYGRCISLSMIDLDGFKKYNDKFGHASGDVILTDFANSLKEGLRGTDTAFRYGGDEFIVILPSTNAERAKEVIERTRKKWLKKLAEQQPGTEKVLGFSAGIAQFPENAETVDGLVFLTDTALYYAKRGGKQRVMLISDLGTTSLDALSSPTLDQIYALAATVDTRDPYTYGHSKRVAAIAESLGRAIGLHGDELAELVAAAFLHDIGKVGVADVILTKPGKPEKEEWEAIKKHCAEGAKIIQHVKELASLAPYILHHHEWYNGTGYPDKLKGQKIPLAARIISVADAYDTMTAKRPYREAISPQEALKELERCSGTQFDPKLIEALRRISKAGLQVN